MGLCHGLASAASHSIWRLRVIRRMAKTVWFQNCPKMTNINLPCKAQEWLPGDPVSGCETEYWLCPEYYLKLTCDDGDGDTSSTLQCLPPKHLSLNSFFLLLRTSFGIQALPGRNGLNKPEMPQNLYRKGAAALHCANDQLINWILEV